MSRRPAAQRRSGPLCSDRKVHRRISSARRGTTPWGSRRWSITRHPTGGVGWRWADAVRRLRSISLPTAEVLWTLEAILITPERMDEESRWDVLRDRQDRQEAGETLESLKQRLQERAGPLDVEEGFLLAEWETPSDAMVRLVYADWLDEQGQAERATVLRLQHQLDVLATNDPGRLELESAVSEARRSVDRGCMELWDRLTHPKRLASRGIAQSPVLDSPPPITDPGAAP